MQTVGNTRARALDEDLSKIQSGLESLQMTTSQVSSAIESLGSGLFTSREAEAYGAPLNAHEGRSAVAGPSNRSTMDNSKNRRIFQISNRRVTAQTSFNQRRKKKYQELCSAMKELSVLGETQPPNDTLPTELSRAILDILESHGRMLQECHVLLESSNTRQRIESEYRSFELERRSDTIKEIASTASTTIRSSSFDIFQLMMNILQGMKNAKSTAKLMESIRFEQWSMQMTNASLSIRFGHVRGGFGVFFKSL
jgi:hypothetical protein